VIERRRAYALNNIVSQVDWRINEFSRIERRNQNEEAAR
jgi:hypothetical protein